MIDSAHSRLATQLFVLGREGTPVGCGFICGERHLMTCAHVVADAIRDPTAARRPLPPQSAVEVRFAINGRDATTRAVPEGWRPLDDPVCGDVAILELIRGTIPAEARAAVAARVEPDTGDKYTGLGMTADAPEGTPLNGRFRDYVAADRRVLEADSPDRRVGRGCSGAAIYVLGKSGVAGMVVEMQQVDTGLLLPVSKLQQVWPIAEQAAGASQVQETGTSRLTVKRHLRDRLFTFDREPQSVDFGLGVEEVWKAAKLPLVYVIGGLEADRADMCQDRCLDESLGKVLGTPIAGDRYVPIKLPWGTGPFFDEDRALAALARGLAMAVGAVSAAPESIAAAWSAAKRPFFFFSDLPERPWTRHERLIGRWCQFLEGVVGEHSADDEPLIHFLRLRLPETRFKPSDADPDEALRDHYERLVRRLPKSIARPLPPLEGFNDWMVDKWLTQMCVQMQLDGGEAGDLKARARDKFTALRHARLRDLEAWINELG